MEAKVELINNPYEQRLRILINGEAVSVYSNLEKYMDEPFCYWCDRILDGIYEECNHGFFRLHMQSRKEELDIMEVLSRKYPHCVQYSSSPLVRQASLLERLKGLNRLLRNISGSCYHTFQKKALFVLPESMRWLEPDLLGLEVKNLYCAIQSQVVGYQEYLAKHPAGDILFLLSDEKPLESVMQKLQIRQGFGIRFGNGKGFQQKIGDMFLYETGKDTVFDTIFDCLLLSPLPEIFCDCIRSLPAGIREQYRENLEELQSVSLKIVPVPEKTVVEVGRSSRLQFRTDPEGCAVKGSQFHYSYSRKGLIRCNGLLVEGLAEGTVTLHIYREGEQIPCAHVDYTVIRRNRITDLRLEEDVIQIGEGGQTQLRYTFLPADADNESSIEWISDDLSVAAVNRHGTVRAMGAGSCIIRCFAEQVSTSCRCTVKHRLRSIKPDPAELEMVYGQSQTIRITLAPENCIDDQIVMNSMDMRIANVVGRTVTAIGIGSTRVVIQNQEETVRIEVPVTVMTEKEFKKRQKQQGKDAEKSEKKGFLAKLFH